MLHKRHLGRASVAVVALVLAGCGNVSSSGKGGSASAKVPGVTKDTIKIGATLPMTGTAGVAGQGLAAGLRIAADEINSAGGIDGHKLELELLDDGYVPARTVANIRRLVSQDKVYALVAPAGSQALPGTWSFIKESNTPVWGPVSPADPKMQQVYILAATRTVQDQVGIDYLAAHGVKRLAFIGQDNDLGAEGSAAIKAEVPAHPGMTVVATETTQPGSTDVSSAVNNVKNAKPDGLVVATDNLQVALILKQLRSSGLNIPVVADQGAAGTGGPSAVGPAGTAATGLLGGLQVQLPSSDATEVSHWRDLAGKYTGEQGTSGFSLQTYSYLKAFAEVLKRMDGDYSYDNFYRVADSLADNPIDLGMLPPIQCGPLPDGHTCARQAALAEYRDGAWSLVQDFVQPKAG